MKYYLLQQLSSNIKETGTQFQCVEGIIGDIQQDFIPYEGKIDFAFKLPEPFMEKKAIPTTRLYAGMIPSWFIVFRDYFVNVLKEFNVGEFQDWDIKVHRKGVIFDDYKLFYMTCKNKVEANKIAYDLVKKDLVACANIIPSVKSYFKWNKKKVNIAKENILIGKTVKKNINKIILYVKKVSSYDCPCVVFVDIKNGNKDFLSWIKSSTK